ARDQQVAVRADRDRIAVEVVEGTPVGRHREVRVGDRHVVQGVPAEQHVAGGHVDYLDHVVIDDLCGRAALGGQVHLHWHVAADQRRVLRGNGEFVQVGLDAVAGPDVGHDLVVLVHQDELALAVSPLLGALVERQHGLAVVGDGLEAVDHRGVHRVVPDEVAVVVHDGGPVAPTPGTGGRDEQVTGGGPGGGPADAVSRRPEVRLAAERVQPRIAGGRVRRAGRGVDDRVDL